MTDDRGAVAVLYALSFLILLTFIGLSVDVGAAFAKRQEAQNGADAAAVAVAAECLMAKTETDCPGDYSAAREIALENERTGGTADVLSGDIRYSTPEPHHVTVTVTAEQANWFLPALTGQSSFTVKRSATVNYGSPVAGTVTVPVAGSECIFPAMPPDPDDVIPVEIWLPQNATQANATTACAPGFPSGGFAWLDGDACTAEVGTENTVPSDPGASAPAECRDLGKPYFKNLADSRTIAFIPLFETSTGSGGNAVYTVTRFAVFEMTGFHAQQYFDNSDLSNRCSNPPDWVPTNWNYNTTTCFKGNLLGYKDDLGDFDLGGPITELTYTKLVG